MGSQKQFLEGKIITQLSKAGIHYLYVDRRSSKKDIRIKSSYPNNKLMEWAKKKHYKYLVRKGWDGFGVNQYPATFCYVYIRIA